jgi:serine/threonine-protein kinase PpkA
MTAATASSFADMLVARPGNAVRAGVYARPALAWPRIGGYRVQRRVGQGRMSTAWLAQDLRRGGDVVLKVRNAGHGGDAQRDASFTQEFEIPLAIRNKHVIRVFDQCTAGAHSYIAMEYLDGGDLAGWIRRGITASEAVSLLRQAALALAELHQRGLVHCDVKPANLLLRADGELVLADFGLARRIGETSPAREGIVFGTPRYAAPEQTQGGAVRPAADVYSLGGVFYEMLRGTPPFAGTTPLELQCQHLMAAVPRLPPELARFQPLIDSMLEKDAHRRLPDGDAVRHQVDRIASRCGS